MIYDTYAPTENIELPYILQLMNIQTGETFCDLGSGDGRMVKVAAEHGAIATGIEYDLDWYNQSVTLLQNTPNTSVIHGDIYTIDFTQYDILYTNLSEDMCRELWDKFLLCRANSGRVIMYMGIEGFRRCHSGNIALYDEQREYTRVVKFTTTENPWFIGLPGYTSTTNAPISYTHVVLILE